ncbi:MAG TPA: hypothetical protein VH331_00805 [Allosphingosinicella sp.]|jgi:hypothetical protein|nr:hypothetical protein [Allosphingosinicella sp.]
MRDALYTLPVETDGGGDGVSAMIYVREPSVRDPEPVPTDALAAADVPAPAGRAKWLRWVGPLISVAIITAVLLSVRGLNLAGIAALLPRNPLFWMVFAVSYVALPASEWMIYRRLWHVPRGAFLALLRKLVSNEMLFGYSGEFYFYAWARQSSGVERPQLAIKDVSILSALTGVTFALLCGFVAWLTLGAAALGPHARQLYASAALVLTISLAAVVFRGRVFSLPAADRRFIGMVHTTRLIVVALLTAIMWHIVLPDVALRWWLLLVALQLVVSRLPLVTNKDFIFAGIAIVALGRQVRIAELLTMMAGLMVLAHVSVALVLTALQLRAASKAAA